MFEKQTGYVGLFLCPRLCAGGIGNGADVGGSIGRISRIKSPTRFFLVGGGGGDGREDF